MLENAQALTTEYGMLPDGGLVLCAVSGGADSMCLLHWLTRRPGIRVRAAHFDHRLRGAESDGDAAFVRDWCEKNGVPLTLGAGDVRDRAAAEGRGIEETARDLRYAFLRETARDLGADRVATAHTADDNAETVLLRFARGTGVQGLAGIPPRRGDLVRPLLTTTRAEVEAYLRENAVPHREDGSNADEAYARNRIRARVVPVLRELNPRFAETAAAALRGVRAENDFLTAQAGQLLPHVRWAGDDLIVEAGRLADLPQALAPRAVRLLLERLGDGRANVSAAHLNAVAELARGDDPSACLCLPDGLLVQRVYGDLLFTLEGEVPPPLEATPLNFDGVTAPAHSRYVCTCVPARCPDDSEPGRWYFRRDALGADAALRPRARGDELTLPGRDRKSVKKLLIDAKVPRRIREQIPVLADGDGAAALAGFGPERSRLAAPGEDAWRVSFE